jgi:hypothetical protein
MRAGNASVQPNGQVTGTGLLLAIVSRLVEQNGAPEANAQKYDQLLIAAGAAQVPPVDIARSQADHDAAVQAECGGDATAYAFIAKGIADYLQPKTGGVPDRDQTVTPADTSFWYAPAGSLSAPRTLYIASSISGDFLLLRNDSAYAVTLSPPSGGALVTVAAAGGWAFAMQVGGTWRVLAGS